jgi:hypothetical protein
MSQPILCKHLRTKSMFIPALAQELAATPEEQSTHSAHYWCNCTVTETGPDDHPVGPQRCQPSRQCYEE